MSDVTPTLPPGRVDAPADYPGCPVTVTTAMADGEPLRSPRWGLWGVFWAMIATVLVGGGFGALLFVADAPVSTQVIVGTAFPWVILAGWPIFATLLRGNGPRIDLGLSLTWSDTGWGVLAGVAGLFLAGIAALITRLVDPEVTSAAADAAQELEDTSGRLPIVLFALMIMVGAPIVEELFFRGYFFAALRKRGIGAVLTVTLTAVVFAGFHFEPTRFLVLLPTGLLLGWVRWKTGSTGSAMVAHGVVNAPGAIVLLVGLPDMTP